MDFIRVSPDARATALMALSRTIGPTIFPPHFLFRSSDLGLILQTPNGSAFQGAASGKVANSVGPKREQYEKASFNTGG
jgi:hypothetical protein